MNLLFAISLWRICLFLIAAVTYKNFSFTPQFPYSDVYLIPSHLPNWIWGWGNFDGVHYLSIAKQSYVAQYTQAFFPLYPLLLRFLGFVLHDKYLIISGIFISFITFYFGLNVFYKLLQLDYSDIEAKKIITYLLLFPTSFYFGALYTEALFFLLIISAFWCARKKKWWSSSILGMLASATRITGVFILPALLWEWYLEKVKNSSLHKKKKTKIWSFINEIPVNIFKFIVLSLRSPMFYLVPLGLISYMVYLQLVFHDFLYFWHAQSVFGANRISGNFILFPQVVWRYIKILTYTPINLYHYWVAVIEFFSFIFCSFLLVLAHQKRVRTSYLIFAWFVVIVPTLTGTFSSLPRYILLAFPMFIVLGLYKNKLVFHTLKIIFLLGLILLTINFIRGWWVA